MNSEKLRATVELVRPVNVLITSLSIPVAFILSGGLLRHWGAMFLAAATGACVAAGANAINDYFDVEIDRINKPERPLPSGTLSRRDALAVWLVLSAAGLSLNFLLSPAAFAIAGSAILLLILYSSTLKRTVLVGNIVVGLMTGMAFIYGGVAAGHLDRALLPALFAFLINVAREVIKDIEDIEGDRSEGAITLPVKYGIRPALLLASAVVIILITATIAAYLFHIYNNLYLALVLVIDAILLYVAVSMWRDSSRANMKTLSTTMKLCMGIGLVAIYLGS